ncbi:MAG TPA: hypothetical protein PK369_02505 [Thermoclostridium sp.]|nr:hypothetical protein [Clostridiaceae bacterium]HOQ75427.1 hypothetical protein [Thermoclostridium sp.]HPU44595.1 hypothetical protein [Thermoclostridium sp.]
MKKVFCLAIALILILSLSFAGCQRNENGLQADLPEKQEDQPEDTGTTNTQANNTHEPLPAATPPDPGQNVQKGGEPAPDTGAVSIGAVMITSGNAAVRKDMSEDSEAIVHVDRNYFFPMLEERQDSDGNTWYLIQTGFGQRGWIPDWLCEKADKQTTVYISERGRLLDPEIDEDLYIRALLMDEYTLKF